MVLVKDVQFVILQLLFDLEMKNIYRLIVDLA